ncbi:MAG: sulfatase-like hydrolase/transferase [Bacteroidetes bacterium]|nr:sulfatase-like hydrolase/transferase [Bacteroidota bacterium]MDA1122519.1 sulfatase-like hydrolase/transferase [Bacteroidota bacterium]
MMKISHVIAFVGFSMLISCSPKEQPKPNFLFIFTDDQTNESIRALNNSEVETPNIDKLVEGGVTFTHCFNQGSWSGAVCVASRSMLITGQTVFKVTENKAYLSNFGLEGVKTEKITEVPLWGEVLSQNGYETFCTGKWHNTPYALLKGFDKGKAVGGGFYETFDKNGSKEPGYGRSSPDSEWKPWDKAFTGHWTPKVNDIVNNSDGEKVMGEAYSVNQHTSELYADKAVEYLENDAKNSDNPFFMFVAFNAPHDPRQSPKEFVDKYPLSSIKVPENYLDEHPFDQGEKETLRDEILMPFPRTKEGVQLHRSEYYAMITHLDQQMGRILAALEKSGKAENTYIIFSSDHGLALGQHGLMGKQNQYDHSVRMPLIIKGPGLEKGKKVSNKVYLQSIFATTCDLASIKTPETVEFKSLNGLLQGSGPGGEDLIFGTYKAFQRMIRSDEYKLIIYPEVKKIQLFDLINDPKEMNNLAGKEEYENVKKEMMQQLLLKQKELGDYLVLDPVEDYDI